jgi:hypothetical protein
MCITIPEFDPIYGIVGTLYSCGPGQVVGVPCTLISLTTAVAQKAISTGCAYAGNEAQAIAFNRDAKRSLQWAGFFALGMIPVLGGPIGYHLCLRDRAS